jgi:hypothetical protein
METQPHDLQHQPAPLNAVSRRRFLGMVGLGAGTVAVAGTAGLTWYTVDRGVFATGTGPAYTAWDNWNPATGTPVDLVHAAVLAANAHNTQPWLFHLSGERIDLFADTSRNIGAMDPLRREMAISLGCAVENLALAAPPHGRTATVTLMPDPADRTHVARIDLTPTPATTTALYRAIPLRHTNRAAYDTTRPVTRAQLDALSALIDIAGPEVVWFTSTTDRATFGDLTVRATQAIIADPQQAADDFSWYRSDWHTLQSSKDGITIDASGLSPLIRTVSKLLPISQQQDHDGWLSSTRDTQVPSAAAFGALVVPEPLDPVQRLATGRVWQRMHLTATLDGLAMQPLCQVAERIDREASAGLTPEFTTAMAQLLPPQRHAIFTFRVGYPTTEALPSPRRPASTVVS